LILTVAIAFVDWFDILLIDLIIANNIVQVLPNAGYFMMSGPKLQPNKITDDEDKN